MAVSSSSSKRAAVKLDDSPSSLEKNARLCVDLVADEDGDVEVVLSPSHASTPSTAIALYFFGVQVNCVYIKRSAITDEFGLKMFDAVMTNSHCAWSGIELRILLFFACDRDANRLFLARSDLVEFYNTFVCEPAAVHLHASSRMETSVLQDCVYRWCVDKTHSMGASVWQFAFPKSSLSVQQGPVHSSMHVRRVVVFNPGEESGVGKLYTLAEFDKAESFEVELTPKLKGPLTQASILVLYPWAYTPYNSESRGSGGARVYRGRDVPEEVADKWELLCSPEAHRPENKQQVEAAFSCCSFFSRPFAQNSDVASKAFTEELESYYLDTVPQVSGQSAREIKKAFNVWRELHRLDDASGIPLLDRMWCYKLARMKMDPLNSDVAMFAFSDKSLAIQDSGVVPTVKNVFVSTDSRLFVL